MNLTEMITGVFSKKPRAMMWKSGDGTMKAIVDMDDKHLINAFRLLHRNENDIRQALRPALKAELEKRGLIFQHPEVETP